MATSGKHLVLLGDSIFDNGAYTDGGPDLVTQLRKRLPSGWRATLAAIDGDTVAGVQRQLGSVPLDATHLVISVGGNDALLNATILSEPSRSVADSLGRLAELWDGFRQEYRTMLELVLRRDLPTAVCTIYDPRFPDLDHRRVTTTALSVINDCIIREAVEHGVPIFDLRVICDEDRDFANPIEPSSHGGLKVAGAIASAVSQREFGCGRCQIFTR